MIDQNHSFRGILTDDEELIKVFRRHYASQLKYIVLFLILLAIPFFLLFPLVRWSSWGIVIFFGLVFVALFSFFRRFLIWRDSVFLITSRRFIDIDRKGLFRKEVTECAFSSVHDATWQQKGVWQTLFQTGTLEIQTAGSGPNIEIFDVYQPQEVQKFILSFREQGREQGNLALSEALSLLENIKFRLGEEKFQKLLKLIK